MDLPKKISKGNGGSHKVYRFPNRKFKFQPCIIGLRVTVSNLTLKTTASEYASRINCRDTHHIIPSVVLLCSSPEFPFVESLEDLAYIPEPPCKLEVVYMKTSVSDCRQRNVFLGGSTLGVGKWLSSFRYVASAPDIISRAYSKASLTTILLSLAFNVEINIEQWSSDCYPFTFGVSGLNILQRGY